MKLATLLFLATLSVSTLAQVNHDESQFIRKLGSFASGANGADPALMLDAQNQLDKVLNKYVQDKSLFTQLPAQKQQDFLLALQDVTKDFEKSNNAAFTKKVNELHSRLRAPVSHQALHLNTPQASAKVRVDLIRNAKKEILIATHIWADDMLGNALLGELIAAKQKNPQLAIKLLIDDWESSKNIPLASRQALESMGIEVYRFRPKEGEHLLKLNNRMHDKQFIVDGLEAVQGDKNISKDYYGLGNQSMVGEEVYIKGEAVDDIRKHFNYQLQHKSVVRTNFEGKVTPDIEAARKNLIRYANKSANKGTRFLEEASQWRQEVKPVKDVRFFSDNIDLKKQMNGTKEATIRLINMAKKRLVIQNPYIVLPLEIRTALKAAADRGVAITVLTSGAQSNDMKLVAAAWPESRKFLASLGATIYEHPGPSASTQAAIQREADIKLVKKNIDSPLLKGEKPNLSNPDKWNLRNTANLDNVTTSVHNKVLTIDDQVHIASFNFDNRSANVNTEVITQIESKKMADLTADLAEEEIKRLGYVKTIDKGRTVATIKNQPCHTRILSHLIFNIL